MRREIADAVAVHGQLHRHGARRHAPALLFEIAQGCGVDRLDFGHDDVGPVLLDRGAHPRAVKHGKDLARVGHLHRRRVVVAVAGHDPAAEPLGSDGEFAAEFARAEKEDGRQVHAPSLARASPLRIPDLPP